MENKQEVVLSIGDIQIIQHQIESKLKAVEPVIEIRVYLQLIPDA